MACRGACTLSLSPTAEVNYFISSISLDWCSLSYRSWQVNYECGQLWESTRGGQLTIDDAWAWGRAHYWSWLEISHYTLTTWTLPGIDATLQGCQVIPTQWTLECWRLRLRGFLRTCSLTQVGVNSSLLARRAEYFRTSPTVVFRRFWSSGSAFLGNS